MQINNDYYSNDLLIIQEEQKAYLKKLEKEKNRMEDLETQLDVKIFLLFLPEPSSERILSLSLHYA